MAKAKEKVHTQEELEAELKAALEEVPSVEAIQADAEVDMSEFSAPISTLTPYTTDLLNKLQEIESSLTSSQFKSLIDYDIKGGVRPDFADTMLTQAIPKIEETVKIVTLLQLLQLPGLFDRQKTLQENILKPEILQSMTYSDMSEMSVNIQKQINDILQVSLKVLTQITNENRIPTKVEKLANALMGASESTRNRIEEILEDESE